MTPFIKTTSLTIKISHKFEIQMLSELSQVLWDSHFSEFKSEMIIQLLLNIFNLIFHVLISKCVHTENEMKCRRYKNNSFVYSFIKQWLFKRLNGQVVMENFYSRDWLYNTVSFIKLLLFIFLKVTYHTKWYYIDYYVYFDPGKKKMHSNFYFSLKGMRGISICSI